MYIQKGERNKENGGEKEKGLWGRREHARAKKSQSGMQKMTSWVAKKERQQSGGVEIYT